MKNFLAGIKRGLAATKEKFTKRINELFARFTKVDDSVLLDLEEILILGDVGVATTTKIIDSLKNKLKRGEIQSSDDLRSALKSELLTILGTEPVTLDIPSSSDNTFTVVLFVGVNGTGKTTAIGKLAYRLKQEGKKVILAAADTFRAAAIDQLEVWANRVGCEIIKGQPKADPAAVVFDAISATRARKRDVLLVDTAGRLHTKYNLMEELKKIDRVIRRELRPENKLETLLVLDATTGQNALQQARLFKDAVNLTGLVLTKLDGTAKGGIIIAIKDELQLPVKLVGVGQELEDLIDFDPVAFVDNLLMVNS